MTMKRIFCAMLLCAALPACATDSAGSIATAITSPAPIGDKITFDERGMYAVEALYNVPASAYRSAVQRGAMTPALRATVRPLLLKLRDGRNLARTAYKVGDRTSWDQRVAELLKLKAQVSALLPSSN
jgi:hypothetical protein